MGNQWLADGLGVEISDHGGFYVLAESNDLSSPWVFQTKHPIPPCLQHRRQLLRTHWRNCPACLRLDLLNMATLDPVKDQRSRQQQFVSWLSIHLQSTAGAGSWAEPWANGPPHHTPTRTEAAWRETGLSSYPPASAGEKKNDLCLTQGKGQWSPCPRFLGGAWLSYLGRQVIHKIPVRNHLWNWNTVIVPALVCEISSWAKFQSSGIILVTRKV